MGVTAIKSIVNEARAAIVVINRENIRAGAAVEPGEAERECDIWIPWCASEADFEWKHYLVVDVRSANEIFDKYYVWQGVGPDGDFVRISREDRFVDAQSPIPGDARVDGNRDVKLVVSGSGLRLEEIRRP